MTSPRPPFLRILAAAFLAQILLIAATAAYMLTYSNVIAPGQGEDHYLNHVRFAAPVISVVAGAAIFYALAFWLGRAAIEHRMASAFLFWLGFVALSTGLTVSVDGVRGWLDAAPIIIASHLVKLAGAYFGARATVGAHSIAS
ncbi:hypothetical protein U91I_01741 [alpha proteobacterium U9-1i]|nr:hypothetical protein U91I_01741 [alpha proteobacterium U9-1i]